MTQLQPSRPIQANERITPEWSGASETACKVVNETFLSLDGFAKMRMEMIGNSYPSIAFAASLARAVDRVLASR